MTRIPFVNSPGRLAAALLVCGLGLGCAFSPTLRSGLRRVQTDPGDSRLVNYQLEYGYRWLVRAPGFERLWSPPFYYPERNTAGYSDIQFASLPLYAPWRLLGCAPDTAFQLWMMTAAVANFAAALLLLRGGLGFGFFQSLAGAYLIAFGAARTNSLNHPQLYSLYFLLLALYAACRVQRASTEGAGGPAWIYAAALCLTLQAYSGFYLIWFSGFLLALFALALLARAGARTAAFDILRRWGGHAAAAAVLAAVLVAPMAICYARVARTVGVAKDVIPAVLQPRWASWLNPGAESWLYRGLLRHAPFRDIPAEGEHRVGLGLLVTALAVWGLWRARKRPVIAAAGLTILAAVVLATRWPGDFSLWELLMARLVPGLGAIRAPVRMGSLISLPLGIGFACALGRWGEGVRWRAGAALFMVVLAVDQGVTTRSYDKFVIRDDVAAVAAAVTPDCRAFLFAPDSTTPFNISWKYHNDAMWASAESGVPTVNGQAGRIPPTWIAFNNVDVTTPEQRKEVTKSLRTWSIEHGLDPGGVCLIVGTLPMNWPG